jgi:hypothetical protein
MCAWWELPMEIVDILNNPDVVRRGHDLWWIESGRRYSVFRSGSANIWILICRWANWCYIWRYEYDCFYVIDGSDDNITQCVACKIAFTNSPIENADDKEEDSHGRYYPRAQEMLFLLKRLVSKIILIKLKMLF